MKLIIVAGGGGHFAPALAVIEKLPKDWEVLVVGRKYVFEGDQSFSLEYQTAKKLNIPFQPLTTGRLQRKFTRYTINSLLKIPVGLAQATNILTRFKPDVVLSFGGYVSVPITLSASILRIPIVIHEQTLEAGIANKMVANLAKKICISWEQSGKFFPESKTVITGNPLRKEFEVGDMRTDSYKKNGPQDKSYEKTIYITGGSSGSHAINVLIEGCIEKLLEKYNVIHQVGEASEYKDFERLVKLRENMTPELQSGYRLYKFIDPSKVADFLNKADLVISRSGMNTVTELMYFGKPSILIPLPYGQHLEQLKNAEFIKNLGIAEIAEQNSLTPEKLLLLVDKMFDNIDMYIKNAEAGKKLIDINAADKIIEVIKNVRNET
ncbi:MAG TPA: UDP-N-acetylglucosamine--N-acetylmuramyl-(pentapeptide) pyrophosphoryl-undecaprenol N-acetylglucosamine transferase [Candidatus Limnocylindrales bacterium]|nr:UDP-N-acetylglucosamine--N-acetylmuramyl-(pentapeptide) pyrophosphoryl-undecaprenol N-acetylglucosamine transferase [Candidatus Limnocylindrales bacterium]